MRTVVITGATRGLGRALAESYLASGHRVMACGRSIESLAELARGAGEERARIDSIDVTEADAVEDWARRARDDGWRPDLVIANAGVINDPAPLWRISPSELARVLAVNVAGAAHTVRAFAPAMVDAGAGVLALLSSGWGRSTSPEVAPYCASKWAVEGMASALAQELPSGVAAYAVNPGVIDTDMLRTSFGDAAGAYEKPDEWVGVAAPFFLGLSGQQGRVSVTVE